MGARQTLMVGLGELLWDLFPEGKQLGGAPANFAYYAAVFGNQGVIASCLGTDALGHEAFGRLEQLGLPTAYIQFDPLIPTGTVNVLLDGAGQPTFTITQNVAWDHLKWTPEWQGLAKQTDVVCFGSLAQRSPRSRTTIQRFLQSTRKDSLVVFDVNLRQAFHSVKVLTESLELSKIMKVNEQELHQMVSMLNMQAEGVEDAALRLLRAYELELVCVTRGSRGSLLVTESRVVEHPGYQVAAVDTVGAGDAFTAALIHFYLQKAPLEAISEAANRLGAWVSMRAGATPTIDQRVLKQIMCVELKSNKQP